MRKEIFAADEYYHIYNRGNDKRNIFLSKADYFRFQALLFRANQTERMVLFGDRKHPEYAYPRVGDSLVHIGAYCLMPNHFHLLVRAKDERGISDFMQRLGTAYTMYFNVKYDRSGSLFQGTFKAKHVETDRYLRHLFGYIHLNPSANILKEWELSPLDRNEKVEKFLSGYRFSSYSEYSGTDRAEKLILDREAFPDYFSKQHSFADFIRDWSTMKTELYRG